MWNATLIRYPFRHTLTHHKINDETSQFFAHFSKTMKFDKLITHIKPFDCIQINSRFIFFHSRVPISRMNSETAKKEERRVDNLNSRSDFNFLKRRNHLINVQFN